MKKVYVGTNQVRPASTVQTFDFQNDGALNWTGLSIYGTPNYVSGEGWTIGSSSSDSYQSAIMPPSSIYKETLYKVKIWFYKGVFTATYRTVGTGFATSNFTNGLTSWCQLFGSSANVYANVYDGSDHPTQTTDVNGEVIQEWNLNDDGSLTLSLNGGTPYNLGQYANLFRTNWSNQDLGLSIGRWNVGNGTIYIRKVEITTA